MDKGTCAVDGCELAVRSREWCNSHYQRFLRCGDPLGARFVSKVCKIDGCDGDVYGLGWCGPHWRKNRKYGDPLVSRNRVRGSHVPCSVADCDNNAKALGWCVKHYSRSRTGKDPNSPIGPFIPSACSVPGCSKVARTRDYCPAHYRRWARHGDPSVMVRRATTNADGKRCQIQDCERQHSARGYCTLHYNRWQASSNFEPAAPAEDLPCAVDGCTQLVLSRGWCPTHYTRHRKYGDVFADRPIGYHEPYTRTCDLDGCEKPHAAGGLCSTHRNQWRMRISETTPEARRDLIDYLGIIRRDPCVYCGAAMEHVDHILAVTKGGPNDWWNLAPTCRRCNTSKRTRDVLQFMLVRLDRQEADGDDLRLSPGRPLRAARPSDSLAG